MTESEILKILPEIKIKYVLDNISGFNRERRGNGFCYRDMDHKIIKDKQTLERIKSLRIPPAWTNVWICPNANGHLQATGRDAKGRKQYLYHPKWHELSKENKFSKLVFLAKNLPMIRKRVEKDLNQKGITKEKVLATLVWILMNTYMRVGNEEYTKENNSFGLTTLRDKHAEIKQDKLVFEFIGKSHIKRKVGINNPRIARIVSKCRDIPGQQLFQYYDENGKRQAIDSGEVNQYLKEISGEEITAKNFRTWGGTLMAAKILSQMGETKNKTQAKKNLTEAVKLTAKKLGNKPATCKKYYIHPGVLEAYKNNKLTKYFRRTPTLCNDPKIKLNCDEYITLKLIENYSQTI
jgi:DNA topoisomerase-1